SSGRPAGATPGTPARHDRTARCFRNSASATWRSLVATRRRERSGLSVGQASGKARVCFGRCSDYGDAAARGQPEYGAAQSVIAWVMQTIRPLSSHPDLDVALADRADSVILESRRLGGELMRSVGQIEETCATLGRVWHELATLYGPVARLPAAPTDAETW